MLGSGEVVPREPNNPGLAGVGVRMEEAEAQLAVPGAAERAAVVVGNLHAELGRLRLGKGHRFVAEDQSLADVDAAGGGLAEDRVVVRLEEPDVPTDAVLAPLELPGMSKDVVFLEQRGRADRAGAGPVEDADVGIAIAEIGGLQRAVEVVPAEQEMRH